MADHASPTLLPLGDAALLVRFGTTLSEPANRAAVGFARRLGDRMPPGVTEVVPSLVSVLMKYDPAKVGFEQLAGEVRLLLSAGAQAGGGPATTHQIGIRFDGKDVTEVAATLGLSVAAFVSAHTAAPLRVLATGFAPGFVYCGFHPEALAIPRRAVVRPSVPAGTVLFAAGQTAIAATAVPTGWHVIGHTAFRNFDAGQEPPTQLVAGDRIVFEAIA